MRNSSDPIIYIYNGTLRYLLNNKEDIVFFLCLKVFNSDYSCLFSCSRNVEITFTGKPQLKKISFQTFKQWYLINTWSDKVFKDISVNQVSLPSLHRGSLEIMLTVHLKTRILAHSCTAGRSFIIKYVQYTSIINEHLSCAY